MTPLRGARWEQSNGVQPPPAGTMVLAVPPSLLKRRYQREVATLTGPRVPQTLFTMSRMQSKITPAGGDEGAHPQGKKESTDSSASSPGTAVTAQRLSSSLRLCSIRGYGARREYRHEKILDKHKI